MSWAHNLIIQHLMCYTQNTIQVPIMARRVVSETNNEGPIPSPEAILIQDGS